MSQAVKMPRELPQIAELKRCQVKECKDTFLRRNLCSLLLGVISTERTRKQNGTNSLGKRQFLDFTDLKRLGSPDWVITQ